MGIKANKIIPLFTDTETAENKSNSVIRLILEYCKIKSKLNDVENQSWYFQKGLQSNRDRLARIIKEYKSIRRNFNKSTVDDFIEVINDCNSQIEQLLSKRGMGLIDQMVYHSRVSRKNFYNELIQLKSLTPTLMPIYHYYENPEALLKIMD
ncbi:MAG: hypothetical protein LC107_11805 [Chitinophagales bacterium]|nr:hypothetical protein [Chitinophagales bacterium]